MPRGPTLFTIIAPHLGQFSPLGISHDTKAIVEKINVPCPKCGAALIKRKTKRGKVFYGCEKYPECSFVSWDKPVKEKCPKCGGLMVHKMGHGGGFDACIAEGCGYTTKQNKQDKKGSEE